MNKIEVREAKHDKSSNVNIGEKILFFIGAGIGIAIMVYSLSKNDLNYQIIIFSAPIVFGTVDLVRKFFSVSKESNSNQKVIVQLKEKNGDFNPFSLDPNDETSGRQFTSEVQRTTRAERK